MRRLTSKSVVKYPGLTGGLPLILFVWSVIEVGGMRGVAVKCIDIPQNTDSARQLTSLPLTLRHESVGIKQD